MLSKLFTSVILSVVSLSVVNFSYANTTLDIPTFNEENINAFIESAYTPTYDCPAPKLNEQIDIALESALLTTQQTMQLMSMKSHGLICASKFSEALVIVQRLLSDDDADRNARYYASAIFQHGFVYDVQSNAEDCQYYALAQTVGREKYVDVHLSASLAFITECMRASTEDQIFGIFDLLESVTKMDNPAALAHAYNRVGVFYKNIGQVGLSAYHYKKAFDIGQDIYTDENLLTVLGNLILNLDASNDIESMGEALEQFRILSERAETNATAVLYNMHKSRYYLLKKDYDNLTATLVGWASLEEQNTNSIYTGFYRWFSAESCYHNNDVQCIRDFRYTQDNEAEGYKNYFYRSNKYREFMVRVNLMLGDIERTKTAFDRYNRVVVYNRKLGQDFNKSINLGNLHNKLGTLEETLAQQEQHKYQLVWGLVCGLLLIFAIILWFVRAKYINSKSYDSVTGILTSSAVIKKLVQLPRPSEKCTNALAIFDIANFTEVNLTLGSTKSDFVLEQIAKTLQKITRNSDLLGRFGTEQFILCLVDIDEEAAQSFFERAKDALKNTFSEHNNQHGISVDSSMSIYYSADTFDDINEILRNMLLSLSMKVEQP